MELLEKVETALNKLEDEAQTKITLELTYGELRAIRSFIKVDDFRISLSADNLYKGMDLKKSIDKMKMK